MRIYFQIETEQLNLFSSYPVSSDEFPCYRSLKFASAVYLPCISIIHDFNIFCMHKSIKARYIDLEIGVDALIKMKAMEEFVK